MSSCETEPYQKRPRLDGSIETTVEVSEENVDVSVIDEEKGEDILSSDKPGQDDCKRGSADVLPATLPITDNINLQTLLSHVNQNMSNSIVATAEAPIILQMSDNSYNLEDQSGNKYAWQLVSAGDGDITTAESGALCIGGREIQTIKLDEAGNIVTPISLLHKRPPPNCPEWATRLIDCEAIGESWRGWLPSEVELDIILTYHKQLTGSFWGTRQAPPSSGETSRLMWRSQYVPFDGIPFINCGSRAIVMECQYGPRRKGSQSGKKIGPPSMKEFRQTCPARIYIKKVRKFPDYAIDINVDKKTLKQKMDSTFTKLKQLGGLQSIGEERWYVYLPTQKAHEYHNEETSRSEAAITLQTAPPRLQPQVVQQIRELVSNGTTEITKLRRELRRYVEKVLFTIPENVPPRHDVTYFPTVNDLQNQLHQALQDIENGILPNNMSVNVEIINGPDSNSEWQTESRSGPQPETVTVTLTPNAGAGGAHIISRVETHLSDGTTEVSDALTPETASLLSRLHPSLFNSGNLNLIQVQPPAPTAEQPDDMFTPGTENPLLIEMDTRRDTKSSDAPYNVLLNDDNLHVQETADKDTEITVDDLTTSPHTLSISAGHHDVESSVDVHQIKNAVTSASPEVKILTQSNKNGTDSTNTS